jgi:hypothetical protein
MVMDAMDYAAQVETAKTEFERDTAVLRERLEQRRKAMERDEETLRRAQEDFAAKLTALSRRFAGLAEEAPEVPHPLPAPRSAPSQLREEGRVRSKRGAFDGPLYELAKTVPPPFSAPQIRELWNAAHPEAEVHRTTVKGALERHRENGKLEVVHGGGRGNANPRTYKIPE